jgi:hypothetical protein
MHLHLIPLVLVARKYPSLYYIRPSQDKLEEYSAHLVQ